MAANAKAHRIAVRPGPRRRRHVAAEISASGFPRGAVAAREVVHRTDQRVQAAVGFLTTGPEALVGFLQPPVGFFAMVGERHRNIHQLANHIAIGFNHALSLSLPLFEVLDVHRKLRLLLDDEIHAEFDAVRHGGIIA